MQAKQSIEEIRTLKLSKKVKHKVVLLLSKANIEMSKAEAIESCKIYFRILSLELINNLLILEIESNEEQELAQTEKNNKRKNLNSLEKIKTWLIRLALTKEAYLLAGKVQNQNKDNNKAQNKEPNLIWELSFDPLILNPNATSIEMLTYKISTKEIFNQSNISYGNNINIKINMPILGKFLKEQGFCIAKMKEPDVEFVILNSSIQLIGAKIWENTTPFEERRAHLRPILHPTAINPRLARAMINLAGSKKEVFDPFCGAGGTLIEANEIGLDAKGCDIDPIMIKRAKINLSEYPKIKVEVQDGFLQKNKIECAVTDVPYGKSSKLDLEISKFIEKFLDHYSLLTNKIVFCSPKGVQFEIKQNWKVLYDFEIYIHKSLSRRILVLEQ